jgi:hypothetical protein
MKLAKTLKIINKFLIDKKINGEKDSNMGKIIP